MSKQFSIDVPVPCHENWNNMTPEGQGRFCLSCQKTVVDFSRMTDYELIQYFKNLNGNTCGRFTNDQLKKNYSIESTRCFNWFKYFIHILIPTLLFSAKSFSQGAPRKKPSVCATPSKKQEEAPARVGMLAVIIENLKINGSVFNNKGEPLEGASISIKGTKIGVAANSDGLFVLKTEHRLPFTIVVSHAGYEPGELSVNHDSDLPSKIILNETTLKEVEVVGYPPTIGKVDITGMVQTTKKDTLLRCFRKRIADTVKFSSFKFSSIASVESSKIEAPRIYPNPLQRSKLLTIEFTSNITGEYSVTISDLNGRHVQIERFNALPGTIQRRIRVTQSIIAGAYVVTVIDSNGKRVVSQKLILMD